MSLQLDLHRADVARHRIWESKGVPDTGINLRPVKSWPEVPLPRAKLNEKPEKALPVDDIIRLYTTTTLSLAAIGNQFGISDNTVRQIVSAAPKRVHPLAARKVAHDIEIAALYRGGHSLNEIGRRFGISRASVSSALKRTGIPKSPANHACQAGTTGKHTLNQTFPLPALKVKASDIQRACATYYGITREQLCGSSRTSTVVRPRHVSMYLLRAILGLSLTWIAKATGHRDHTTATHAVRNIHNSLLTDADLRAEVSAIVARLREMEATS